jgi:RNA polymerase sigma-70 factor (ECF subfamily)
MAPQDDMAELIRRAVRGERAALERLLLDHFAPLTAHLARRMPPSLQSVVGVEDNVQSTFTNVFQSIGRFEARDDASFLTWLLAIADNQLRDAVRFQKRKKRGGDRARVEDVPTEEQSCEVQLVDILVGPDHTPSRSAARREGIHAIRTAMAGLPEEYRRAIELRYFDGYSLEEAAILLGRTTGAVRGLIDRARRQLRESLGRASHYLSEN